MSNVGPYEAVPPAISTRPSFSTVTAWPDRAVTRSPTRAQAPDAGSYVEMADEGMPSLLPPATTTRPSARATETAPLGIATSPAAAHVPLATRGTSARRTTHEEPSTARIRSATRDLMRVLERLTFEEIFMIALMVAFCLQHAGIGRSCICVFSPRALKSGTDPGRSRSERHTAYVVLHVGPCRSACCFLNIGATFERSLCVDMNKTVTLLMRANREVWPREGRTSRGRCPGN